MSKMTSAVIEAEENGTMEYNEETGNYDKVEPKHKTAEDVTLELMISGKLIDFAMDYERMYPTETLGDIQGVCQIKAQEIIKMVREAA